ncbi:MAG: hypothetical protein J4F32_04730 [Dehalococcoidia bacterium]|nr:hypothetical protein [Dehalococcoidia bacterium]
MDDTQTITQQAAPFNTEQRCSLFSQASGDDPIGQARTPVHQVFVEAPFPWEFDFMRSRGVPGELAGVLAQANEQGADATALGAAPDTDYSRGGLRHLFVFSRPEGLFSRFEKHHYLAPADRLGAVLEAVLQGREAAARFGAYRQRSDSVRELFVCTHGVRDACCGAFGYPVYRRLRDEHAGEHLRVWRTSHTGGHRFAPTLLDYPDGRYWAHAGEGTLDAIVRRTGEPKGLARHFRGWAGLGRLEQVVDREVFLREGWRWLDYAKRGATEAGGVRYAEPAWLDAVEDARVRIDFRSPEGDMGAYVADLVHDGDAPFGGCGKPMRFERQFKVVKLERVPA